MNRLIYNFFQLILKVFSDFFLNAIDKSIRSSQPLTKKNLTFVLYNRDDSFIFILLLVLIFVEQSLVLEKKSSKRYAI